eukprot:CAMPEP_0196778998 /NCGR_PEP_ID=MMETSP1104-20130614/6127_1 /TAXON_ID=33652 /ORGANISM="Cafeteria sp., Strain Caron Lab Isolate" /LENGTH=43 /DNA_ID= /DNA_START= /DNA_END= /DNA_ORIENTATION=
MSAGAGAGDATDSIPHPEDVVPSVDDAEAEEAQKVALNIRDHP